MRTRSSSATTHKEIDSKQRQRQPEQGRQQRRGRLILGPPDGDLNQTRPKSKTHRRRGGNHAGKGREANQTDWIWDDEGKKIKRECNVMKCRRALRQNDEYPPTHPQFTPKAENLLGSGPPTPPPLPKTVQVASRDEEYRDTQAQKTAFCSSSTSTLSSSLALSERQVTEASNGMTVLVMAR